MLRRSASCYLFSKRKHSSPKMFSQSYSGGANAVSAKRMRPSASEGRLTTPTNTTKKEKWLATRDHPGHGGLETEENPFGLKDKAIAWLQKEMIPHGNEAYLLPVNHYRPLVLVPGRKIPASQFQQAAAEYGKRSVSDCDSSSFQPVLVAVGVNDLTMSHFVNDEEGPMKMARYLFFPSVACNGHRGALFMTYMPGPIHGTVDVKFHGDAESWLSAQTAVTKFLNTGCSSGAHNAVQPDHRIFPFKKYRDRNGNDVDKAHKTLPHTRMYWEVEYDHRNIVELRQHGAKLMRRTPYTRLFLGVTISKPDDADLSLYEAAIILWGKDNADDTISVLEAVSFGTRDLCEETKYSFSTDRQDRLPAVGRDQWRRPENAGANPVAFLSPPPQQWLLQVPFTGLLYKVMTGKRNQHGDREYLLDTLSEGEVSDMAVDLLAMSYRIYMTADAAMGDSSEEENE